MACGFQEDTCLYQTFLGPMAKSSSMFIKVQSFYHLICLGLLARFHDRLDWPHLRHHAVRSGIKSMTHHLNSKPSHRSYVAGTLYLHYIA